MDHEGGAHKRGEGETVLQDSQAGEVPQENLEVHVSFYPPIRVPLYLDLAVG